MAASEFAGSLDALAARLECTTLGSHRWADRGLGQRALPPERKGKSGAGILTNQPGLNEGCDCMHIWSKLGAIDAYPRHIWARSGRYFCQAQTNRPWPP